MDGVLREPATPRRKTAKARRQERAAETRLRLRDAWQWIKEEARIYARRFGCGVQALTAGHQAAGPISFLLLSAAVGTAFTLATLYTTSYAVTVDGLEMGLVSDQWVVEQAVTEVETQGSRLLGYDYQVESQISYQMGLSLKSDLTDGAAIETYFYTRMDDAAEALRKFQISVNGTVLGVVEDRAALDRTLNEIKSQYLTADTVYSDFVEPLEIASVYRAEGTVELDELKELLTANTTGETTYTVVKGDTFNAIAYANDMSASELKSLNPDLNINRLMIGDVVNVKEIIPFLSVVTQDEVTYTEPIPCPVETVEDSSIYKGNSKILVQGVEGEALVEATISFVNGRESGREIHSTETLREPTVTTKAVGTKERPKTASTGNFQWPYRGRISSYFGGRYLFGSYSYHSGLDISGSYGATIVAADGGTVTFSGYKGSYGNLVIITHDNGTQTYYGHCSSLLVSSGTKVYKGQAIARVGSTGRSTGNHLHFEVRVGGTAVNPLSYLP